MALNTLVERAKGGDRQAMGELYQQTCQRVYALALRLTGNKDTAMDVVQESYLSALEHLEDLRNPDAFLSWMFQIAANRCRKVQRQAGRLVSPDGEDEEGTGYFDAIPDPDEGLIPEAAADSGETRRLVMELVDRLPPDQRECVILYYFTQCSVEQIAQVQSCAPGTVKSRLNYARKKLKEGVLALEARDNIRLHTLAPVGLLFACLDQEMPGWPAFLQTWGKVAAGVSATGAAAASAGAASAAAGQGAGAGAGAAAAAGGSQTAGGVSAAAKGVAGALKMKIAAGVAAAAVLAGGAGVVLHQPAVTFSDPAFEQNVRIFLDKPTGEIREGDLKDIHFITLAENGMSIGQFNQSLGPEDNLPGSQQVESLEDIRLFPELKCLTFCDVDDALLGTITESQSITSVYFETRSSEEAGIKNFAFVEQLPALEHLVAIAEAGADLSPVENLTSLTRLDMRIRGEAMLDISNLTQLSSLRLSGSGWNSTIGVRLTNDLPELKVLIFAGAGDPGFQIDLDLVRHTPSLEYLSLNDVWDTDLTPIAQLAQLRAIVLAYNEVPLDLTPLASCPSLEVCKIDDGPDSRFLWDASVIPDALPVEIGTWEHTQRVYQEIAAALF